MSTHYDPDEERKFYDQAQWGVLQSYHQAVLADLLALLPDDARSILDVGCGDGLITNELPLDRDVVGLDISPVALKLVKRRAVLGSAMELPFEDCSFDLVMANDVVEHFSIEHRERVLNELERVANKYIVVTTPFTERLVRGYRSNRNGRTHVNRHFDSFDVATIGAFFKTFRMTHCVFSGDEWEDELVPVEYLKRAQLRAGEASALFEGAVPALEAALEKLRTQQAAYLTRNPLMVDQLRRRTEIVAIFEAGGQDVSSARRLNGRSVELTKARETASQVDLLEIQGSDLSKRLSPVLPLTSRRPYVVFDQPTALKADSTSLETDGLIDLKFGFFADIAPRAQLVVNLRLLQDSAVAINVFDPIDNYRNLYRTELRSGEHEIKLELLNTPVCQFGYLFELIIENGPAEIILLRIEQDDRPTREEVAAGPDYVSRESHGCQFYTGLGITERLLPLWFEFAEKIPSTPSDLFETPAAIESLMIEGALLQSSANRSIAAEPETNPQDARIEQLASSMAAEIISLNARIGQLTSKIEHLESLQPTIEALASRLRLVEQTTRPLRAINALVNRGRSAFEASTHLVPAPRIGKRAGGKTQRPAARPDGLPARVTMLVPDDRIDRRVLLEGRTLASRGVEVAVIAVPFPGEIDIDQQQFPDLDIVRIDTSKAATVEHDLRTGRLANYDFDWKGVYFYTHQFLEAALERPADLIVAHDLPVLPAAIAAADSLGARLFYDAHELYPEQLHFGPERIELYRAVEHALISIPDQVVTVNQSIAQEMKARYGVAEPMVILNAPDASDRRVPVARSSLLRDAFSIAEDTKILLFQGSLSLNRNLETLVEAMAHATSPDIVLIIMGPGEGKRRELEGIARGLGLLGSKVHFHDAVPQNELLAYTASADIGIIPYPAIDINTTLCTPNKLFEFFVAGIPILANDLPELRRFVLGRGAGLTHPMGSAVELAQGIDLMAASDLASFRVAVAASAATITWQAQEPMVLEAFRAALGPIDPTAAAIDHS